MKRLFASIILSISLVQLWAFNLTTEECRGSYSPYPVPVQNYSYPDSLTPVFINHVGRHGSRYPTSGKWAYTMRTYLHEADSLGTITPLGKRFLKLVGQIIAKCDGQWGALDSLGMAEHRGIAARMCASYPKLLSEGNINAISTNSPRAIMSMYSFTHQLSKFSDKINISANSGPKYSPLLRFFDTDTAYVDYLTHGKWKKVYADYYGANCTTKGVKRLFSNKVKLPEDVWQDLALSEYYIIGGMDAAGMKMECEPFLTKQEMNQLSSIFNLRQYLQRTASVVSNTPIKSAMPLLMDIITSADSVLNGKLQLKAKLRFAHAETLMPLLSLMAIPNCYYLTNYYDTVVDNWKSSYVVPMGSNLQLIYFTSPSGTIYVRGELNEVPVTLIHGNDNVIVPWDELRTFWLTLSL